jgi:ATP-dependent DNA ligase
MLPRLLPMLAVPATPFDSPEYSFECKWDGIRALTAVEPAGWRLVCSNLVWACCNVLVAS